MLEALLICLTAALLLSLLDWSRSQVRRAVGLNIRSITYHTKPNHIMTTNLRSPSNQFAQLLLEPRDANGSRVVLDVDAIIAEVTSGEGAKTSVLVLDRANGDRDFAVNLIPGETPGEYAFKVRGDALPGEGVEIIEEDFVYTATPNSAVTLGVTVAYLPKTSLPTA